MPNVSILVELDDAEAGVTRLCEAIQRKTNSVDLRKEYQTLIQQATVALNKIRSISETDDFLRDFKNGSSSVGER